MVKITKRNVTLATLTMALMGSNASLGLLGEHNLVLAAKNHEGVCQVETKTGEITFNAQSTTVETTKPVDLLAIIDGSGSMENDKAHTLYATLHALLQSLPDDSRVMFAVYSTNESSSYRHSGDNTVSRLLTKDEAVAMVKMLDMGYPAFGGSGDALINEIKVNGAGYGTMGSMYGDLFAGVMRPNYIHSVIQITDEWVEAESIDEMFASWAKKNAKTFMSVVINKSADSKSVREMQRVGHPNIYVTGNKGQATINKEVIAQFNTTATEKAEPTARINVTAPQGVTLKEVKLVSPDGKEEVLPITSNSVNVEKTLAKDGNYKVKVKADGLVPENRKVVTTVNISNKEVGKSEILFEGCKDDIKGIDEERTKVNIDFKTKYIDDADLMTGTEKVVTDGVIGIKEIIKTWNTINGKRVGEPKIVENMLQGVIDKVIARGTKGFDREVIKQKIPFDTKYIDDDKLESGKTKVVTDGVEGEKEITKVYVTQLGKRVGEPTVTEKVVKPKVDKVIARGTQQPKDFTYRIVDKDGKVLVDTTKVSQGYVGNEYKLVEVPKLEGYEIETPEGVKLEGIFKGENVNIDFVAYKLGKGITLKTVTKDGKDLQAEQVLIEDNKRVGTEYTGKVAYEIKDKGKLYRLVALEQDDKPVDMKLDKDIDLKGSVSDVKSEYKAVYEEVKVGDVKVEFVDDTGKTLKSPVLLNTKDSLLGTDYKYDVEARLKVGEDTYALTKTTLEDKEVKDIKGQFDEKAKTYKLVYKKVVKPEPKKLPKTSSDNGGSFGLVSTIVGLGLLLLGFVRKLVLK